ncbi:hypothetical protein FKP32DRAFT_1681829 [Trametes sanguinea]|nr:hypothetical protein FKP32DRAFT_1681829 [Trametes sanguinea]
MPPKRKSDVLHTDIDLTVGPMGSREEAVSTENAPVAIVPAPVPTVAEPAAKKARISEPGEGSSSGARKSQKADRPWQSWRDVILEGEEEGDVPIYDDCNEIRRKIRLLLKQPGFKITHWLRDIGNINNNSYQRFMRATGPRAGAENGTYYAAYVYFEKVRIFEGKKKTAKRIRNEQEHPEGLPRRDISREWVLMPAY